jgi:molecular chaperone GrpE
VKGPMPEEEAPKKAPDPASEVAPPAGPPALAEPAPSAGPPAAPEVRPPADWETRFKYLFADFENFRKRVTRERESVRLGAEAEVLRTILPILEAFEKAREFVRKAPPSDPVRQGMELLGREWDGFLNQEGLRPVARIGGKVNAEDHEVVGEAFAPRSQAPGTIAEVVQQGYRFKGGLLRPAKVLLARELPKEMETSATPAKSTASSAKASE